MKHIGIHDAEQEYMKHNAVQKEFAQRYVFSGRYRKERWKEYLDRHTNMEAENGF